MSASWRRRGIPASAARAGEVPGHRRVQPGRVLHGPGRRAEAAAYGQRHGDAARRADRLRAAGRHRRARSPWWRSSTGSARRHRPGPGAGGHSAAAAGDLRRSSSALPEFEREVFPVLTPLAIDPGHPFPMLRNRSLNLAILCTASTRGGAPPDDARGRPGPASCRASWSCQAPGGSRSAARRRDRVARRRSVPRLPGRRLQPLPGDPELGPAIDEDEADDLLETVQKELRRRERGKRPPGDRRGHAAGGGRLPERRAAPGAGRRVPHRRAAAPGRPGAHLGARRPARAQGRAVLAAAGAALHESTTSSG